MDELIKKLQARKHRTTYAKLSSEIGVPEITLIRWLTTSQRPSAAWLALLADRLD